MYNCVISCFVHFIDHKYRLTKFSSLTVSVKAFPQIIVFQYTQLLRHNHDVLAQLRRQ